jgi:nitrite reductase/ring-hydroxylating ferredoxin subunit
MNLSRRRFIKFTGTTVLCTCLGAPGTSGCASNPESDTPPLPTGSYRVETDRVHVALARAGALLNVGGAVKCTLDDRQGSAGKVIIVRPGKTDYRAFADACTHNGKELNYLHGEGLLACCGRSSRFELTGKVIHGPAEDALRRYRTWEENGELVIEIGEALATNAP